jgi:hypothetical protein
MRESREDDFVLRSCGLRPAEYGDLYGVVTAHGCGVAAVIRQGGPCTSAELSMY